MDQEENKFKNVAKGVFKSFVKRLIIIAIIGFTAILLCGAGYYSIKKEDFEKVSEEHETYSTSVNQEGQIIYTKTESDGTIIEVTPTEMAENIKPELQKYVSNDEEEYRETVEHIIGAETVTTMPYIDPSSKGEENGDNNYTDITGQIKFYRYTGESEVKDAYVTDDNGKEALKEKYRLTYVTPEDFKRKKTEYLNGNSEEIFNHFTMDTEGNIVVAYGSKEEKNISTLDDTDLTEEVIRKVSGENVYKGDYKNGFYTTVYSINEKKIDYLSLVEQYTMPSNLLYALLIQTSDADFVKAIADLAYENEIAIAIYDNETVTNTEEIYKYEKIMQIEGTTNFDFSKIKTTSPEINYSDLNSSKYSYIPNNCNFYTSNGSTYYHRLQYYNSSEPTKETSREENMYVVQTNDKGEITKLGKENEKVYTTKFNRTINSTSEPTVGVLLADTWVAKWKATYAKDEDENQSPTNNSGTLETNQLIEYDTTDKVLNAFSANIKNDIKAKLDKHINQLVTNSIEEIVNVAAQEQITTVDNVDVTKRKDILSEHISSCADCMDTILKWWSTESNKLSETNANDNSTKIAALKTAVSIPSYIPGNPSVIPDTNPINMPTIDRIYSEVTNFNGMLRGTEVYTHYLEVLEGTVNKGNEEIQKNKERAKVELEKQITTLQTLKGGKRYTNISFTTTTSKLKSSYSKTETTERTKDGEKFSKVFNNKEFHSAKQALLEVEEWFWENIDENEDTAKIKNVLKYLLNIATNSEDFGKFTLEEINELFGIFEPQKLLNNNIGNTISPFGTQMTRDEFIQSVQNYNGGTNYSILSNLAEDFYDVCTSNQYNVNPCIAFAWACIETEYGKNIPDNNLFGIGVYNGKDSGQVYTSYKESIEDFCRWVIRNTTSVETKAKAQEYATVNSKFNGNPENNIYALFSRYMYLGDTHIADEPDFNNPAGYNYYNNNGSNWGSGGRIYIYHMYEQGGLYTGEYATRCGHSNGSDETTLQEKADYVQYSVESRIKIARNIFGNGIFLGSEGTYEKINDKDRFGVYTSSSGRTYTEWIQSSRTTWGGLYLNAWKGTMAQYGCGLYTSTMLLNSVGIDVTPGDLYNKFNYDFLGTMQSILNENGVEAKAKMVYTSDYKEYFSVLLDGHGVMSYLSSKSDYTNNKHWIVVADIRDTQIGSTYGYDLYVLSSTHKSRS